MTRSMDVCGTCDRLVAARKRQISAREFAFWSLLCLECDGGRMPPEGMDTVPYPSPALEGVDVRTRGFVARPVGTNCAMVETYRSIRALREL